MINSFSTSLLIISIITVAFGTIQHLTSTAKDGSSTTQLTVGNGALRMFKLKYLLVFGLAMMADWFQGSYLYSLYHEEFGYDIQTIAILFVIGFIGAGASAPLIGSWADRYGRKKACLYFTIFYALSCVTKMFASLPLLALGRLLGGIATSILFSIFESWLISASKSQGMESAELGELLGRCTLVNGLVASFSGVASDGLVATFGTFKAPFVASGLLLVITGVLISRFWTENYGNGVTESDRSPGGSSNTIDTIKESLKVIQNNPSLVVLLVAMTAYETSLYLFVFLWVPTLQAKTTASLPLGTIFSCFMVSFSLGSIIYNYLLARASKNDGLVTPLIRNRARSNSFIIQPSPAESNATLFDESEELRNIDKEIAELEAAKDHSAIPLLSTRESSGALLEEEEIASFHTSSPSILFHSQLLAVVMLVASCALAASIGAESVQHRFYGFLLFEMSVGLYYPVIGSLRSLLIPEAFRASISSLFRVPMNFLVTLALVSGLSVMPHVTFFLLCLSLISSSVLVSLVIVKRAL